ncbi:hypothetical protein [Acinetobacter indicus]|uniref:hypothetical protein n=1 Tax=Acinetobacter indicus TaxID=756892 RepID=UPI0032B49D93
MNLIEQLGGYEAAKAEGEKWGFDDFLNNQLLEYRRQHNIFEVGDKVVLRRPDQFSEIYTYDAYSEKMDLHFFESESDYGHVALDRVRHATDAEIKAGKRLEVT